LLAANGVPVAFSVWMARRGPGGRFEAPILLAGPARDR